MPLKIAARLLLLLCITSAYTSLRAQTRACANCIGIWTDNYHYTWNIDRNWSKPVVNNLYQVVGSFSGNDSQRYPGCPTINRTLSGTYNEANGSFNINANNPKPSYSPYCNISTNINYSGSVLAAGCDQGSGIWTNDSGNGTFVMTKPCQRPVSETAEYYDASNPKNGWITPAGTGGPTAYQWIGQLDTSIGNYSGRAVTKFDLGGGT